MRAQASLRGKCLARVWRFLVIGAFVLGPASLWGSASPAPASAAGEDLRIKDLRVSVWPEYDDPRLLVIYEGEFTDGGTFPRDVKFKAPKDAAIQMVCALTPRKEHNCQAYDIAVEGEYQVISFRLPIPTFFFEYYGGGIEGAAEKSVNYQFVNPPYAVDALSLEIQQPLKATNFAINPSTSAVSTDGKGFKYYNYNLTSVPADKQLGYAVTYSKSDPKPSVEKKTPATAAAEGQNSSLIVLGSVIGMAAILAGAYWLSNKRNQQKRYAMRAASAYRARQVERVAAPSRPVAAPRPSAPPRPAPREEWREERPARPVSSGVLFCSKCGARLEAEDAFCFRCGEPAKRKGDGGALDRRR